MNRTTTELSVSRLFSIHPTRIRSRVPLPGLLPMLLAVAACGNLTAGGVGEAVVVVSGDSPEALASSRIDPTTLTWSASRVEGPARAEGDDDPKGRIEAEMLLYLVSESGGEVRITDDEFEVSVDLGGVEQDETVPKQIPTDTYTGLRIVFLQIEVRVDAGLVIDGVPVTGPIDIDLETDSLSVLKGVALQLDDAERAEILVDLNAVRWLQAVDPAMNSVDAAVFADLIAVVLR